MGKGDISMITKHCKKHGDLSEDNIIIYTRDKRCRICTQESQHKSYLKCRDKRIAYVKNWALSNKDKRAATSKKWKELHGKQYYQLHKEKIKKSCAEYQKKYKDRKNQWCSKSYKKKINECADSYIRKLLIQNTNLKVSHIPLELIEVKKLHLKIKRKLKEMVNGNN